ncbi:hypothetical protein ACOI1C_22015 [Bacillus sp. DJP31]|uniref:hypothetical protein n=1 Tax=Bacillus sp. DJP31 TaxID=3409789 RepID=UPI003BB6230F
MVGHGRGEVRVDGKIWLDDGYAFQCNKCKEVIVSQNSPLYGSTYLGKYAIKHVGYDIGIGFKMEDPNYTGYNSSLNTDYWDSYRWYWS